MATSSAYVLTPTVSFVGWLQPKTVLEVGCGYGTWGVLLRQHADYPWSLNAERPQWDMRLVGLEAWEGYRNPLWEFAYNEIVVADALEYLPNRGTRTFELGLLVEVLEHLTPRDGERLLAELRRVARHVVVTTPDQPLRQGELEENPYETHRSFWPWSALRRRGAVGRLPASGSTIAVFSDRPEIIAPWLRGLRLRAFGPLVPPTLRRGLQVLAARTGLHPGAPSSGEGPPVQNVR